MSPDDAADNADAPPATAPEKSTRSPNGIYEFREERWVELYNRKIEDLIAVLKSKGVPVLWVGLPAVRGTKATADMLFLDSLYREAAAKAGITYVDVWDGFVDEAGRYLQQGPDFEGQIRRLRSYDGVYFTQAGARKLAHYVEREITRLLAARSAPIALPTEPATPDANAKPGQPARVRWRDRSCRWWNPLSAPINCSAARDRARPRSIRSRRERWSRANRSRRRPAAPMTLSGRTARSDTNRPRARHRWLPFHRMERRLHLARPRRRSREGLRPIQTGAPPIRDFFGFGTAPRQPQPVAPRPQRPPGDVGRAASAPDFFTR